MELINILERQVSNVPEDFSVSIKKDSYQFDNTNVALARVKLFPNDVNFFIGTAAHRVITIAESLRYSTTITAQNNTPTINITILISKQE